MKNTPTLPKLDRGSIVKLLRSSLRYLRPYWIEYSVVTIAIILSQVFNVSFAISPKLIVDNAIVPRDWGRFVGILIGFSALFLLSTFFNLAADYLIGRAEDELKKDLRVEMFTALQYIPYRFFTQTQPGEIVALFASELITFRDTLRTLLPNAFSATLQLGLAVIALFFLDWRLSIAIGIALPFVILLPRLAIHWAAEADFRSKASDAHAAFAVQDNVQSQAVVRAFGLQQQEIRRFRAGIGRAENEPFHGWGSIWSEARGGFKAGAQRDYFLKRLVDTLTNLQNVILNGVVIFVGGYMAFQGMLSVATLLTFIPVLAKAGDAATQLTLFARDLISASNGLERLEHFEKQGRPVTESTGVTALDKITSEIELVNIHFGHNPDHLILNGVTCTIPAGGLTGLVGRSGAGKSTILELLLRIYEPQKGNILYDGKDLRELRNDSLHEQIGVVLQDLVLLNTSVRANIALTKPDATQDEIEAAAKSAGVHQDIVDLPHGYETEVGEGGKHFSPGQRQRIAIARALLRKPSLLLLDEPTASLDSEAEMSFLDTLRELGNQHTVLMVTHRLSTVANLAKNIVVIDAGKVVESGDHQTLLKNPGLYAHFWELQNGFTVSGDGRIAEVTPQRLRTIPLFKNLDLSVLESIAGQFVVSYYEADQVIFHQGEAGARFYILVRGKVAVQYTGVNEKVIELNILEDGDHFGEIALLQDSPRSATVKTLLPTLTLSLERSQFLKLVEDNAEVRQSVQNISTQRNLKQAALQGRGRSTLSILDNLVDGQ